MAGRFVPASQAPQQGGGNLPTDPAGGTGLDPAGVLGLAKSGAGLYGQAGRFIGLPGSGYSGAAGAVLGLGQGIANRDPVQTAQSGVNTGLEGLKMADKLGWLSSAAPGASVAVPALLGGSGAVGASMLPAGAAALGAAGSGAATGTALLGAGGAGAASAAAPAAVGAAAPALSSILGAAAIPLFFIAMGLGNMQKARAMKIKQQTQESGVIRRGAAKALDTLGGTQNLLPTLASLPPEQLGGILDQFREGLVEAPTVEQLVATAGQGGGASKTKRVSQDVLDRVQQEYYPKLRDTQAGLLWALDAAARQGQQLPDWATSFGNVDPAAILQSLSGGYGGNAPLGFNPNTVDYSQAVPGNLVNFFSQQVGSDPKLAEIFGNLPALPGTAPTEEQMAQANAARQAEVQRLNAQNAANMGGLYTGGTDIQALGLTAPYTEGGMGGLLQEAFNATPDEMNIINDLMSRGADPVGIRSAVLAHREQQEAMRAGGG